MVYTVYTDKYVERLKREAIRRWRDMGFDMRLIEMALKLADNWIYSLASFYTNHDPRIMGIIIRRKYEEALRVAENWLKEIAR